MLVPNQLIQVKVIGITLEHYRNLGYDVNIFDTIMVPPEHLTSGSKAFVDVKCDICGDIIRRQYKKYIKSHTYGFDTCGRCKTNKTQRTCFDKYGVDNPMHVLDVKEKLQNTIRLKFGVDNISQLEEIKQKKMNTFQQRYGVNWAMESEDIKNKVKQTCLKKYGCTNSMQNETIRAKAMSTLCKNGNTPTSSQQIEVYNILKQYYDTTKLNYPFSLLSLDIFVCINNIKIDVEYDGWFWHQDKQKDLQRDKFLQSKGFKVLRIRSGELLPTEQELLDAINYLINTEHKFKEIILSDWKEEVDLCQKQLQVAM